MLQQVTPHFAITQDPSTPQHPTPTSLMTTPLHLIAIFPLAINSLSLACHWASLQQPLRTERPSTSTQITLLIPANNQLQHPVASVQKSYPPPPLKAFVCGACTRTAQVGLSLVAPLAPLFKRSSLRCLDVRLT